MQQISTSISHRGVIVGMMLWWVISSRAARAFNLNRPVITRGLARPQPASRRYALFSTLSPTELEELQAKIKTKGDEIRQLKANGVEKHDLAPHVEELLALKSQLPEEDNLAEKKPKQDKKLGKQQKKAGPNKAQEEMSESELRLNRLSKIDAIREAGVEPFEYSFDTTHTAAQLFQHYNGKLEGGEEDEQADVAIAGRIMTRRVFGKLAFFTLQDESGTIQIQFDKSRLNESFKVRSRCTPVNSRRLSDGSYPRPVRLFVAIERLDRWWRYHWCSRNNPADG